VERERLYPKTRLPGPCAVNGEPSNTAVLVQQPLRRLPGLPRPRLTCVPSNFERSGAGSEPAGVCGDRPLERRRTTAITSPLLFSVGEASASKSNSPGTSSRWEAQQNPVKGSPEPIAVQAGQPLRQGVRATCGLLGNPADPEAASCASASGEAIRQKLRSTWILVPCPPANACAAARALAVRWVPMASTDLT